MMTSLPLAICAASLCTLLITSCGTVTSGSTQEEKNSHLLESCREGNLGAVTKAIKVGADPNCQIPIAFRKASGSNDGTTIRIQVGPVGQDPRGATPLFYAIQTRNHDLASALLNAGARPTKEYFIEWGRNAGVTGMGSWTERATETPKYRLVTPREHARLIKDDQMASILK